MATQFMSIFGSDQNHIFIYFNKVDKIYNEKIYEFQICHKN